MITRVNEPTRRLVDAAAKTSANAALISLDVS